MNGGGRTGAHALPPPAAAAATNSSNLVMSSGTTRKKRPPTIDETREEAKKQRQHHHLQVLLGKKRKYEEDESDDEVGCRENDKMFKCNYWGEDPAYAKTLQRDGLQRARIAALDNQTERLLMYMEFHEPAPDAPQQQPEPLAGASGPPIISRPEVPNCPDRYRRFDHDYW